MKHLSLCVIALAVLPGCTAEKDAPLQERAAATPNVVHLTATEYTFTAPDTIAAGWTTFRLANQGGEIHYGHIVQLDSGRTVQELVEAYAEAIRTSGPRPKWVTRFGGPGGTVPGHTSSVTQHLEPGHYVWICPVEDETGAPHFGKGEFRAFVVRAADSSAAVAAPPTPDMTIGLLDFGFAVDSVLPSGRHTVRVHNTGVEPHDLVLLQLAPGRTIDDVRTWLNPEIARRDAPAGEAPLTFESLGSGAGGIAAMKPGMEMYFETDFAPGEYILLCMATAPDGRSHIEHGMIRQVTVR